MAQWTPTSTRGWDPSTASRDSRPSSSSDPTSTNLTTTKVGGVCALVQTLTRELLFSDHRVAPLCFGQYPRFYGRISLKNESSNVSLILSFQAVEQPRTSWTTASTNCARWRTSVWAARRAAAAVVVVVAAAARYVTPPSDLRSHSSLEKSPSTKGLIHP